MGGGSVSPYRTAPSAPVRAPRASWWRRLWSPRIGGRLEIRRLRILTRAEAPMLGWKERHLLAAEIVAYVGAHPPMHVHAAAVMTYRLRAIENRLTTAQAFADAENTAWKLT